MSEAATSIAGASLYHRPEVTPEPPIQVLEHYGVIFTVFAMLGTAAVLFALAIWWPYLQNTAPSR